MNKNLKEFANWYIDLTNEQQKVFKNAIKNDDIEKVIKDIDPNSEINIKDTFLNKIGISLVDNNDIVSNITSVVDELDNYIDVRNKIFENSIELMILEDFKNQVEDKYNLYDTANEITISNETHKVIPIIDSPMKQDFMELVDIGLFGINIDENTLYENIDVDSKFIDNVYEISKKMEEEQNQGYDGLMLKGHNGLKI